MSEKWISAAAAPLAYRAQQAQRGQPKRCATAEVGAVLAVERGGVATRFLSRPVGLGCAGATTTLTAPLHDLSVAREPESMAKEPAAQHRESN